MNVIIKIFSFLQKRMIHMYDKDIIFAINKIQEHQDMIDEAEETIEMSKIAIEEYKREIDNYKKAIKSLEREYE